MISASAADAHRFGRVRRNGYDPDEVDAVVSRLVETLQKYEDRMGSLEDRLTEADASADAIRRTFVAAEKTRDEILDAARSQAQSITEGARVEADELLASARSTAAESTARAQEEVDRLTELSESLELEMASTRTRILADAQSEADRIVEDAESVAAERAAATTEQMRAETEANLAAARDRQRRSDLAARAIAIATARLRREALVGADLVVSRAEERAAAIVADAEREREALHDRAEHLRSAITSLQDSAAQLAALAGSQASAIDLTEVESLERAELDLSAVDLRAIERAEAHLHSLEEREAVTEPIPEDADAPDEAADGERSDSEPVEASGDDGVTAPIATDGGPLPEPPRLLTVAEATDEIAREDAGLDTVDGDDAGDDTAGPERSPTTYYQKSTGIPLSERVKLARRG